MTEIINQSESSRGALEESLITSIVTNFISVIYSQSQHLRRLFVGLLFIAALLCVSQLQAAQELIENGTFEFDSDTIGYPDGWTYTGRAYLIDQSGNQVVVCAKGSKSTGGVAGSQTIDLEHGRTKLRLKASMKATNVISGDAAWQNARVTISFYDAFGSMVGGWPAAFSTSGTTDWLSFNRQYDIPETAATVVVVWGLWGVGMAEFDNISLAYDDITNTFQPSEDKFSMRYYTQNIEVLYDSEAAATSAEPLTVLPLYNGYDWAITTRWDDCRKDNLLMEEIMNLHGYKGGFYLNSDTMYPRHDFGASYAQELTKNGSIIGGHTMNHPYLTDISRSEMWWEIMAIKIERECDTNIPITSFAFPFGKFSDANDQSAHSDVGKSMYRAGYHHNVYNWFIREEAGISAEDISSCSLVLPGDHDPTADKFDEKINYYLTKPWFKEANPCLTVGVHVSMDSETDWLELDKGFGNWAHRPDWWYCNSNEYSAYRYQFFHKTLTKVSQDGAKVVYEITRPSPIDLNNSIPLSFEAPGAISAVSNTAELTLTSVNGINILNVGHNNDLSAAKIIDAITNNENSPVAEKSQISQKFNGVTSHLYFDSIKKELTITVINAGAVVMENAQVALKLPLAVTETPENIDLGNIGSGESITKTVKLNHISDDPVYTTGVQYFVAQCDFMYNGLWSRLYATTKSDL